MAENKYHKVVEMVRHGFDTDRVYMATEEELRAKGWKPSGDYVSSMEISNVVDEANETFAEAVVGWDANGDDAWVSERTYPSTTAIKIRN